MGVGRGLPRRVLQLVLNTTPEVMTIPITGNEVEQYSPVDPNQLVTGPGPGSLPEFGWASR